jgi:uncharacterized protein (UPF0248 family)
LIHQKKFTNIKLLLNEIKWTKDITNLQIYYLHRGALNNTKKINGGEITQIDAASLNTKYSTIPYHRIHTIQYDSNIIFKRQTKK